MARSNYIYVVTESLGDSVGIVSAFTVKHELKSWLEAQRDTRRLCMHVYRCKDAPSRLVPCDSVDITEQVMP